MNIAVSDIKTNLLRLIGETDDVFVLKSVQDYFDKIKTNKVDWWDTLSVNDRTSIEKGLEELDNGEQIPYEQVKLKARKLFEKNGQ